MRNKPTGTDLIFVARRTLVDQLIPALPEEQRALARQVARAMNIASREIEAGDRPLKRAMARVVQLLGKGAKYEAEYAKTADMPGALERTLGELSSELCARIRAGEFDASSSLRDELHEHLLQTTLEKLQEDDPKYLVQEGFA